jgi:carbonic anhydrase
MSGSIDVYSSFSRWLSLDEATLVSSGRSFPEMNKLIRGIIQFRETQRDGLIETFQRLALGQQPDALFIACSDSRMAVNVFASTDPGDLFVLRNVGNLVPPNGHPAATGTAAAVEFAVDSLRVRHIIVCGHSDCGAIRALCKGPESLPEGPLRAWLEIAATGESQGLNPAEVSRRNVLAQLEHLREYPSVAAAISERELRLHGLWFDIMQLDVQYYEEHSGRWTVLDAVNGARILSQIDCGRE